MFSIDERNKIKLTIGDTASFSCTVTTLDDKPVTPTLENTLTFYIDDIGFSKQAIIDNGQYEFIIAGSDTLPLEEGVYNYRVVYETEGGEQYTIFQDVFIELLGDKEKSDPEPTPEPEPEPEHQHNYVAVLTTEPTCTGHGSTLYQCSSCGIEYTGNFVEPLGHDEGHWDYTETNHTKYCNRCGAILVDGHHVFDNDGICIVCGYDIRNNITPPTPIPNPPGHDHNWVLDSTTQATCLTAGVRRYVCSSCGDTEEVIDVPALGHWYVNGVCVRCGATDPDYVPDQSSEGDNP